MRLLPHLAPAVAVCLTLAPAHASLFSAPFPGNLERYLTAYVKLDAQGRQQLLGGLPVTKLLESDPSKEVAIFGAVWIDAPVARYITALQDIERFESGEAFRVTKKISAPPRIEDFSRLELPPDDIKDLRTCKIAACELKLSANGIERIRREIQWNRPDAAEQVNRMARQIGLDYVKGYLEGGDERLAVYRDAERPTFVAREFASMIERLPALTDFLPDVRHYLLEYPKATLPNSSSFVYWQEAKFGLKPTIRINHVVISEQRDAAVVASKMIYATHYFWTALELRVLVRDPQRGQGFWFVTESRSRSDGLSGFTGRVIRGKVRGESEKGTAALLRLTKERMEARGR
jgi:hypothetical protein